MLRMVVVSLLPIDIVEFCNDIPYTTGPVLQYYALNIIATWGVTYGDADVEPMSEPPGAGRSAGDVDGEYEDDEESEEEAASTADVEHVRAERDAAGFDGVLDGQTTVLDALQIAVDGGDVLIFHATRLRLDAAALPFLDRFRRFYNVVLPINKLNSNLIDIAT